MLKARLSSARARAAAVTLRRVRGLWAGRGSALRAGLLHQAEGLQELIDVDAAVLVEVDASGQVTDAIVCDVDGHVRAEELPGVSELVQRDEP